MYIYIYIYKYKRTNYINIRVAFKFVTRVRFERPSKNRFTEKTLAPKNCRSTNIAMTTIENSKNCQSMISRVLFSSKVCTVGGVFDELVLFPAMASK